MGQQLYLSLRCSACGDKDTAKQSDPMGKWEQTYNVDVLIGIVYFPHGANIIRV